MEEIDKKRSNQSVTPSTKNVERVLLPKSVVLTGDERDATEKVYIN